MKIAIVSPIMNPIPPSKYGGIERIIDQLARGLAGRKHEVTLFCSGGSRIKCEGLCRVESSPYPTGLRMHENRQWEEKQVLEIISRQKEFDLIHLNYEPIVCHFDMEKPDANLIKSFDVPIVSTFHNSANIDEHREYYKRQKQFHDLSTVFVSESQRNLLPFFNRAEVIHNALPLEKFSVEVQKENFLLFLGRITPFKGILEAIAVAKKVNIPLVIMARLDSSDREFYEEKVKPEIDGNFIRYAGEAGFAKKTAYLRKARALLFPILWEEPFGLVMVEALASGTPVVAFRRGSVPEIVKDGLNGFVVDGIDEMAQAVRKVSEISPWECRKSVEGRFSSDRMVGEYEKLFQKLVSCPKKADII